MLAILFSSTILIKPANSGIGYKIIYIDPGHVGKDSRINE